MRPILLIYLFGACVAFGSSGEPVALSFFFDAPPGIDRDRPGDHGYGLIDSSIFLGDPIRMTLTVLNAPATDHWLDSVEWIFEAADGQRVRPTIGIDPTTSPRPPHAHALREDAAHFAFRVTGMPAGRYVVWPQMKNSGTDRLVRGPSRKLSIYRGDENRKVRQEFLREQARRAFAQETYAGYETAKAMLLEAASDNRNPDVYQELADGMAPWAPPQETAEYYRRAAELARTNIETKFGRNRDHWSVAARELYDERHKRERAFRELVPYYTQHFDSVQVSRENDANGERFVMRLRSNGAVVRTVAVR